MKMAMEEICAVAVQTMFDDCTMEMLQAITKMVETLAAMVAAAKDVIESTFLQVYSVLWDSGQDQSANWDPALAKKILDCRTRVLPDLLAFRGQVDDAMELLGIEREDLDLDIVGVESFEQRIEKKLKEAEDNGMVVDLLDSDNEEGENDGKMPAVATSASTANNASGMAVVKTTFLHGRAVTTYFPTWDAAYVDYDRLSGYCPTGQTLEDFKSKCREGRCTVGNTDYEIVSMNSTNNNRVKSEPMDRVVI